MIIIIIIIIIITNTIIAVTSSQPFRPACHRLQRSVRRRWARRSATQAPTARRCGFRHLYKLMLSSMC
jgi:hypothetical protein